MHYNSRKIKTVATHAAAPEKSRGIVYKVTGQGDKLFIKSKRENGTFFSVMLCDGVNQVDA